MKRPALNGHAKRTRRGSVTVEMALVTPIFVALIVGVSQASNLLETQNLISSAAREGARLAAMDRSDILEPGQTTNGKIETDIKGFLTASGVDGDAASVFIVDATDHTTPMDLDDPANELELFELRIELPYTSNYGADGELNLVSKIVFRNAPATFGQ
jgi:Flp pilus assembly protein TadG